MSIIDIDCKNILSKIQGVEFYKKRILVTGATGQIGSYLLAYFYHLKKIEDSIRIDAFYSTNIPSHLTKYKSLINFKKVNLSEFETLNTESKYDFIVFGAGYGQPSKFMDNQDATFIINSYGLMSCLSMLRKGGKFLYLSTSEIYAGNKISDQSENDLITLNPKNKRNSYILAKLTGEEIIKARLNMESDLKIARICLAYGPGTGLQDTRVLNEFIKKAKINKKIELLDKGDSIRSYCYVSDTIEMCLRILLDGKSAIYNVGNPNQITILGLAKLIARQFGNIKVIFPKNNSDGELNPRTQAPNIVSINCRKYEKEFGSLDYVKLDDGLINTITWQEDNIFT